MAYYLPQYHIIPENNEWWGPGFTEWTNVARARQLFHGHYQPHVPADLGFYDLRLAETRAAQADLAQAYGVDAFCYYHYWFGGKRLLERPFEEVLATGEPSQGFCLCWANQTWSGIWHGAENRVLIEQTYPGDGDHRRHFESLLPAFRDPRYLCVDSKPLFVVYRPLEIPNPKHFAELWQKLANEAGLPGLFLVGETNDKNWNPKDCGLDASVVVRLPPKRRTWVPWSKPYKKIMGKLKDWRGIPTIHAYSKIIETLVSSPVEGIESFPCAIPNWDNTARSGKTGLVLHGSTPDLFKRNVTNAIERLHSHKPDHRLLFIKSWNEWAEGNHLEPDHKFGHQYLQALRDTLKKLT